MTPLSSEEIQAIISSFMGTLSYGSIPQQLLLPASTFRSDIEALLERHLSTPPTGELLEQVQRESALWSNPDLIFFDCRADSGSFGTFAYNKTLGTLDLLKGKSRDMGNADDLDCVKTLPIYQIVSLGFRKGLDESQVGIQSRSTNLVIWYDQRKALDWYPHSQNDNQEHSSRTTNLDEWLGSDTVKLAQTSNARGTWVPYVRNLLGITDIEPSHPDGPTTSIQLPLSSLIVLFLKCSNIETTSFLSVDSAGHWSLPSIDGNQGRDRHLFYNAIDDVIVTVV